MELPDGFLDLVKLVIKEQPISKYEAETDAKQTDAEGVKWLWEKWLRIVFLGGKRSDAEVSYVIALMKPITDLDFVLKTDGEKYQFEMNKILNKSIAEEKNEYIAEMLKEMQNEVFRITASIKGSARYFAKNKVSKQWIDGKTETKESTWELIEELVEDGDVSNIKWTKVILWLHSAGKAADFCPPSRQIKDFVNKDIGPYYRFYEDDKYFMNKMQEIAEEVRKKIKNAAVRDVSRAVFYYRSMKGLFGGNPKFFTPKFLMLFMKNNKLTLDKLAGMMADLKKKEKLFKMLNPG